MKPPPPERIYDTWVGAIIGLFSFICGAIWACLILRWHGRWIKFITWIEKCHVDDVTDALIVAAFVYWCVWALTRRR